MKKMLLAFAVVLALSGSAFAGASQPVKHSPAATCFDAKTHVKLDCDSTGSVEKQRSSEKTSAGTGPRLGISVDPWIMPSAF